jgi:N-acetylglutamate synthase-like GNAT family acetyltransferase
MIDGGSGRCLCGAVRYAFDGAPNWQSHCHCESCRRATASGYTSFLSVDRSRLRWNGRLSAFASSPGVVRRFCPVCGTQMSYETEERPHETDLYAATLDDPSGYEPTLHDHWNEHMPWVMPGDRLPRIYTPRLLMPPDDPGPVLQLIRETFAYMDGRIDPPSSMVRRTEGAIARSAAEGEVWVLDEVGQVVACMVLTIRHDSVYLGKLAVADSHRRRGLARQLVGHAEGRARALHKGALELQSRVELTENHAAFLALGFRKTGETAHAGYDRPTSFTFTKTVGA